MNPRYLLESFEIAPKKSLGQNFLHDPNLLEKIVHLADLTPQSTVLEIGPGTGSLTVKLGQKAGRVVAIEIDERLIPVLENQLRDLPHVRVVHGDFREIDFEALVGPGEYIVVANLPYYITSLALQRLLEARHKPERILVTVQQEVAERLVAKPGDMSLLAVSVQYFGAVSIVGKFGPGVFWPRPEVDSALVRIDLTQAPALDVPDEGAFFAVVRAGFSQKRKQLRNSLASGLKITHAASAALLHEAGIEPSRRAETLTLEEWAALSRVYSASRALS
ncbi:MAG: 16S rRNA (adenine(1518)-N(6)/adenine(1519)-N(6))-dimethyltransferase RsmA [Anaerolineae bacterium]|nr:16S rRNA (adenine(1518)-N(6)/adenine(1519)-N(6))-dimethyltransferase RsmA [Anaerolineae bacterium]